MDGALESVVFDVLNPQLCITAREHYQSSNLANNNIVQELMIEDTPGYREMMRMTHDDFLEILTLVEPACILLQYRFCCLSFPLLSFTTRRSFGFILPNFSNVHAHL